MTVEARQRLDKWLFFARLQKSRTLAAKLVAAGKVRINREKTDNPARAIKPGDVLTITFANQVVVVKVEAPGKRRGPATEARTLYSLLSPIAGPEVSGEVAAFRGAMEGRGEDLEDPGDDEDPDDFED